MKDKERLAKLTQSEAFLKNTTDGYPDGPGWKKGMPLLWEVRQSLKGDRGKALAEAHGILKTTINGYNARAKNWEEAMKLIDGVEETLSPKPSPSRPKVPSLGPVVAGDKSLSLCQLSHKTSGIEQYIAFDSGWRAGKAVLAPELLTVTRQSSAAGADAFYATGISELKYWFGHVNNPPSNGSKFQRGEKLCVIADIAPSHGGPHLHLGIDAVDLIGHSLLYGKTGHGPDYTYGAPTVGAQLIKALST